MVRSVIPLFSLLLVMQHACQCTAEVFRFKDGRVISGTLVKESQRVVEGRTETLWAIEIEPKTFIQIDPSSLEQLPSKIASDLELEYATKLKSLPETAEAHYELAGWCAVNGLKELEAAHYLRVLDMEPNHGPANIAAGFYKNDDGRWVKKERVMGGDRGKVLHKGKWRFPEALASEQAEEERQALLIAATKDLPRWHSDAITGSGKRQALALENLSQVTDPLAVGMLTELLQGKRKPAAPPQMRILYVNVLSRIQSLAAVRVLAQTSIEDGEVQVRNAALDGIQAESRDVAIAVYLGYLKSNDNETINRAAAALGQFNADQAILPLIDALVTEHSRKVGGGNTTYSTGEMVFGGKEQIQKVRETNERVLGTLSQLTGQNFDYNEPQWLAWYASLYAAPADDLRRDP